MISGWKNFKANKGSYNCTCQTGYEFTTDPSFQVKICVDINECFDAAAHCGPDQKCHNTVRG